MIRPTIILMAAILGGLVACQDPNAARKEQIRSEMQVVQGLLTLATQEVAQGRDKVSFLQGRRREKEAELTDYQQQVQAYMMQHKAVIAGLAATAGGGAVAFDDSGEYTQEARNMAGGAALFGAAYLAFNAAEAAEVTDVMIQADAHTKALKAELAGLAGELQMESEALRETEERYSMADQETRRLSSELEELEQQ